MKKIIPFLSLILMILLLVGCNKKNPDTDDKEKPNDKPVIESIRVVDIKGNEVKTDSVFVSSTEKYTYEHLFVWSIYSDETHKDVTQDAQFSSVDITKVGEVTVQVTYKEFSTSYLLLVKENVVQDISVDYMNCQVLYPLGGIFDSAGLSVRATLADGSSTILTDYTLSLKNSTKEITEPLDTIGQQQVVVSYGKIKKEFDIMVYEENYASRYDYSIDFLAGDVTVDEKGVYEFTDSYEAMNNAIAKMTVNNTTLKTKEDNGTDVNYTYMAETYHSYLMIPETDGIEITLKYHTDLLLVVGGLYGAQISFQKGTDTYDAFGGKPNNYTSILYCSLDAGTYKLVSSNKNNRLFGITFQSENATASDLEIDSQNMKKNYEVGESLDLSGLKAYYVWEDGTKSSASTNDLNYKILDSQNLVVNNLNKVGQYKVVFTLGNKNKTVSIEVTDGRSYTGIELDTTNVKKEFNANDFQYDNLKVYGVTSTGRELLTPNTDYTVELYLNNQKVQGFTSLGTYTVTVTYTGSGCANNKNSYTVKYTSAATNIILDTTNVKKDYIVGEPLDISNLVVQLQYQNQTTETLSLNSITRVIKHNNQVVTDLSEVGEYTVYIQYDQFEQSFTINTHAPKQYTSIELDTSEVKKQFSGTAFECNKLKAYGVTLDSVREEISMSEIEVTLSLAGNNVSSFSTSGTYTVTVEYIGTVACTNPTATYTVEYTARKITFGYSGPDVPYDSWQEDATTPLDYPSYIQVPSSSYVFFGFSGPFESDSSFVKIYVNYAKTGSSCWYVYVSPRYEAIAANTEPLDNPQSDPEIRPTETFDHYELDQERSTNNYKLYVAVCNVQTASCNVSIQSTTTANLTLTSPFTDSITVSGVLTDTDGNTKNFNTLTPVFTDLNPNYQYTVSGSISSASGSAQIEPTTFSTNVAIYLTSITEDQAVSHISEQSLEIACEPYLNTVPAGYQLVGFQLMNEAGDLIDEVAYTSGMETAYFTNLTANTKYAISSCYSKTNPARARIAFLNTDSKFTYDFNFVGFWVISNGSDYYRVRMQYLGDTLYTWYVGNYNYFDNNMFCNFALPNELKDYKVVGCKTPLYNITEDVDVEVELVKVESGKDIVAFYGFQGVLIDTSIMPSGASITGYPNVPQTLKWGDFEYEFTSWTEHYAPLSPEVRAYLACYYCTNQQVKIVYPYDFYIFSDKISIENTIHTGSEYYVDYYQRIYDLNGNDVTDSLEHFEETSDVEEQYLGLTPNTEYIFKGYLVYNLLDGNGNQTKEYSYNFKTLEKDATKNITLSYKLSPYQSYALQLSANKNDFDTYIFYYNQTISIIYNDENIQWNYFDLGYLYDESPLYIYYSDRQELDDGTTVYQVYTTKPLVYKLDEVREVRIDEVIAVPSQDFYNDSKIYFIVKGKNVRYANFYFEVRAYYPEFNGSLPGIMEGARFEKVVSDDEVIYFWDPFWPMGAEHAYDGEFHDLVGVNYLSQNKSYSGHCVHTVSTAENYIRAYTIEYF